MMGWSPGSFIPSFMEIGPLVSLEDFLRVFTIYGPGCYLGHVTRIMSSDLHFLVPESFYTKFGSDRHISF